METHSKTFARSSRFFNQYNNERTHYRATQKLELQSCKGSREASNFSLRSGWFLIVLCFSVSFTYTAWESYLSQNAFCILKQRLRLGSEIKVSTWFNLKSFISSLFSLLLPHSDVPINILNFCLKFRPFAHTRAKTRDFYSGVLLFLFVRCQLILLYIVRALSPAVLTCRHISYPRLLGGSYHHPFIYGLLDNIVIKNTRINSWRQRSEKPHNHRRGYHKV